MSKLLGDIQSERWLVAKGVLFLAGAAIASLLILLDQPSLKHGCLLAVAVWCFARAYYFAFYVIEHYIDSEFRFAGVCSAMRFLWARRGRETADLRGVPDD